MEPETSEPEGSQGFASSFHGLLGCHIKEDGMRHRNWYHVTHLRYSDQYEAGGIQLVRQICAGARSMPHIQMHVGSAERLCGNVVRLIPEPHSHVRRVLPIEHRFSHGQHQGQGGTSSQDHGRSNMRGWGGGGQSVSHPRGMQEKASVQPSCQEGDLPSGSMPSVPPPAAPEGTQPQWGSQPRSTLRDPM